MRRTLLLIAAVLFVACEPFGEFTPEVTGAVDDFELRGDVLSVTTTVVYDWVNTGTRALVTHRTTTTSAGFAAIRITDPGGTLVYSHALLPSVTQETLRGAPGTWTIELTLTGYTGALRFSVQTAP